MKTRSTLLYILIIPLLFLSCGKSFLETSLSTSIPRQNYVKDVATLEEYMNGIYLSASLYAVSGYRTVYPELIADNIRPAVGQTALNALYRWEQQESDNQELNIGAESENVNAYAWGQYMVITSCNFVIEKAVEFRSGDPSKADHLLGQALTLRGLCHFNLTNVFAQSYNYTGDASHPGIIYNKTTNWAAPVKGRGTVKEVYENIISDLQHAIILLPATPPSTLVANKLMAQAILARTYLYMENYSAAKDVSLDVIRRKPLMKVAEGYPNDMYKLLPFEKTEVFFQLLPTSSVSMGYKGGGLFPGQYFRVNKNLVATKDIAGMYSEYPGDVRNKWVTQEGNNSLITKFPTAVISDVAQTASSYLLNTARSSELYLNVAECYQKLNMEDSARYYLDQIRKRANPTIIPITATGQMLTDSIYKERRKELAFEGHRMMDLLRWKKGVVRTDPNTADVKSLPYPSNKAIAPLSAIDVITYGLQQNPGY